MLTSIATAIILLGSGTQGRQAQAPALTFAKDHFVCKLKGEEPFSEPLKEPASPRADHIVFRKNADFAVWDGRGLSVRHKNRTKSSRLPAIALTPKLFSREQILKTRALIAKGVRQKDASALSGYKRIGNTAFFLVRWVESTGAPWLEALVKVDLGADLPVPQLVGKFDGLSSATAPVDDRMFVLGGSLCVITHTPTEWSLSKYDPAADAFNSYALGLALQSFSPIGRSLGIFVERTPAGSFLVGRVDLVSGSRRNLLDARQKVQVLDGKRPTILILGGKTLHNLESGMQTPMPAGATVRRTPQGILVWWPSAKPSRAVLLSPDRWTPLAKWQAGAK